MNSFESILSKLNESQYKAATFERKHCMVLAGAGCGKTKTIIARAIYLISQGIPAERIQILSFTRKSASEIYERVRLSIKNGEGYIEFPNGEKYYGNWLFEKYNNS